MCTALPVTIEFKIACEHRDEASGPRGCISPLTPCVPAHSEVVL